jgi:hypothetical protein
VNDPVRARGEEEYPDPRAEQRFDHTLGARAHRF